MSVKAYLELIRVHNVVGSAVSAFMGYVIATTWKFTPLFFLPLLVVSLIAAGGYVINDIYDIEVDKINKPERPLPSGRIEVNIARRFSIVLFAVGLIISIPLGLIPFGVALITIILLYEYARSLKKLGLVGNFIVSLTSALSAYYGGLASGSLLGNFIIPTIYIFFFTLSREFVKGIEDIEGDKRNGVNTLAVKLGEKSTWIIAKIILGILIFTSPLPYFLGFNLIYLIGILALDVLLIYILILHNTIESATKARSLMKIYAIGTLIVFTLGSLRI
ncbi:MFS transporter [Sulfolobus acidocaldarius SUSAZ]|nr:MFS transporter [Sulfolobus acidocaldarius SUSAZ]